MLNSVRCMSSKLFIGARVIIDRDTGRSRGFGFVNFASDDSASLAVDSREFHGRNIHVSYAAERTSPRSFNGGGGGGDYRGNSGGY